MSDPCHVTRPRLLGDPTLVWRGPEELQVGLDEDAVVLQSVPPAAETLLRRLDGRHTVTELGRRLPPAWVSWILDGLSRQGRLADGVATTTPPTVRVVGSGSLSAAVTAALVQAGSQVRLADPLRDAPLRTRQLASMLSAGRTPRQRILVEDEPDARAEGTTLTVVATDTAEPDRVLTEQLVRAGLPHLVLRVQPTRALVGPFVLPGRTACLRCSDLVRAAADPGWPVVACELSRVRATSLGPLAHWAVALAVAHLSAYDTGGSPETLAGTVELGRDGVTRFRRWARHPACSCHEHDLSGAAARMGA